jgi:hypothetical protein
MNAGHSAWQCRILREKKFVPFVLQLAHLMCSNLPHNLRTCHVAGKADLPVCSQDGMHVATQMDFRAGYLQNGSVRQAQRGSKRRQGRAHTGSASDEELAELVLSEPGDRRPPREAAAGTLEGLLCWQHCSSDAHFACRDNFSNGSDTPSCCAGHAGPSMMIQPQTCQRPPHLSNERDADTAPSA